MLIWKERKHRRILRASKACRRSPVARLLGWRGILVCLTGFSPETPTLQTRTFACLRGACQLSAGHLGFLEAARRGETAPDSLKQIGRKALGDAPTCGDDPEPPVVMPR